MTVNDDIQDGSHLSCQPLSPRAKGPRVDRSHDDKIRPWSNSKSSTLSHSSAKSHLPMARIVPAIDTVLSIYPHLDPTVLISIIQRDFRAVDLARSFSPPARKRPRETPPKAAATAAGRTLLATFSNPTDFLSAWLVYSSARALLDDQPGAIGAGLNAYAIALLAFAAQYEWGAVLDYHAEFFADRTEEEREGNGKADPRAWVHEDERLVQKYLCPHPLSLHPPSPWSWGYSGRDSHGSSSSNTPVSSLSSSLSNPEGDAKLISKGLTYTPQSIAVDKLSPPPPIESSLFSPDLWSSMKLDPEPLFEGATVVARYSYDALDDGELTFRAGDRIMRVQPTLSPEWWRGWDPSGNYGWFLGHYVDVDRQ